MTEIEVGWKKLSDSALHEVEADATGATPTESEEKKENIEQTEVMMRIRMLESMRRGGREARGRCAKSGLFGAIEGSATGAGLCYTLERA